jgi:hypothetical protein
MIEASPSHSFDMFFHVLRVRCVIIVTSYYLILRSSTNSRPINCFPKNLRALFCVLSTVLLVDFDKVTDMVNQCNDVARGACYEYNLLLMLRVRERMWRRVVRIMNEKNLHNV